MTWVRHPDPEKAKAMFTREGAMKSAVVGDPVARGYLQDLNDLLETGLAHAAHTSIRAVLRKAPPPVQGRLPRGQVPDDYEGGDVA